MRKIKARIKKLQKERGYLTYQKKVYIFLHYGDFSGEEVFLVIVSDNKFICRSKEATYNLLDILSNKYEIECIIKDYWQDINKILRGKIYYEWK